MSVGLILNALNGIREELKEIRKELHAIESSMKPVVEIDGKKLQDAINNKNHEHEFNFR